MRDCRWTDAEIKEMIASIQDGYAADAGPDIKARSREIADDLVREFLPDAVRMIVKFVRTNRFDQDELDCLGREAVFRAAIGFDLSEYRDTFQFTSYLHYWARGVARGLFDSPKGSDLLTRDAGYPIEQHPAPESPAFDDRIDVVRRIIQSWRESLDPSRKRFGVVLARRYFDGVTQTEAGRTLGVTKERARQIEVGALRTLRKALVTA